VFALSWAGLWWGGTWLVVESWLVRRGARRRPWFGFCWAGWLDGGGVIYLPSLASIGVLFCGLMVPGGWLALGGTVVRFGRLVGYICITLCSLHCICGVVVVVASCLR
jgi:hypothetical protein